MMNEIIESINRQLDKIDADELASFITPKRTIRNGKVKLSHREAIDFVTSLKKK